MTKKDKRIDAYISKSVSFAQPILKHLCKLTHQDWPEVEETISGVCVRLTKDVLSRALWLLNIIVRVRND